MGIIERISWNNIYLTLKISNFWVKNDPLKTISLLLCRSKGDIQLVRYEIDRNDWEKSSYEYMYRTVGLAVFRLKSNMKNEKKTE